MGCPGKHQAVTVWNWCRCQLNQFTPPRIAPRVGTQSRIFHLGKGNSLVSIITPCLYVAHMLQAIFFLMTFTMATVASENNEEWTLLFDGQTTEGWRPRAKVEAFKAVNGELHLSSKENVWVVSDLQLSDFVVEMEVEIPTDHVGFNSGLGFRLIGDTGKPKGYQCEIDRLKPAGVYGIGMGGWLFPKSKAQTAAYQKASKGLFKPTGWNHFRVEAKGPRIRTWLNGKLIAELEHKQSLKGRFGIQHHGKGGTVKFRNLRVCNLNQ